MSNYTILAEDLLQTTPEDVDVTPIPYDFLQSNEIQLVSTYQKLQKASRRRNRILALVYAYYLGELIENMPNRKQRAYLNSYITEYYSKVSIRTYTIFEKVGISQIYRTRSTNLRLIHRLSHKDYISLTQD
jgi:hypothetical protein